MRSLDYLTIYFPSNSFEIQYYFYFTENECWGGDHDIFEKTKFLSETHANINKLYRKMLPGSHKEGAQHVNELYQSRTEFQRSPKGLRKNRIPNKS